MGVVNASSGVKAGTVAHFAASSAPTGWLKANGAAISRTTYAALFAVIGISYGSGDGSTTFNLPDLRGEFVRGWDNGRGVDSGRAFGSTQSENIGTHTHGVPNLSSSGSSFYSSTSGGGDIWLANQPSVSNPSGENRPRNVAMLACIKF